MKTLSEKLASYLFDLEDRPISIHNIWNAFKTYPNESFEKIKFIETFYSLPKIYTQIKLIYYNGCPYIFYSRYKESWQFTQNKFVSSDSDITNTDIVDYYTNEDGLYSQEDEISNNFVVQLIQKRELDNLKRIFDHFTFTEEQIDEFLNLCVKQMKNDNGYDDIDMIVFFVQIKYNSKYKQLISENKQLTIEKDEHMRKNRHLERDNQQNLWRYNMMKNVWIYSLGVILFTKLFL